MCEPDLSPGSIWKISGDIFTEALDVLRTMLTEQQIPGDADLSFLEDVEEIDQCLQR